MPEGGGGGEDRGFQMTCALVPRHLWPHLKKASCATEITKDGFLSDCSISLTAKTNYQQSENDN